MQYVIDHITANLQHPLPVENGHGEVRVLREFSSALATCREFAFSVADGEDPRAG